MKYHQRARVIWQSTLAPNERFVLLAVSDHLGSNEDCWPSLTRLATMTGLNERTIRRALTSLELAGHITVTRKPGRANRYRVIWETLPTLDTESTPLPRTESHPGHNVQGTPDTESTPLDTESNEADQEADQVNGSITPPTPQGAGDVAQQVKPVDNSPKPAEKPEPTAKKSKRKPRKPKNYLTVDAVMAEPIPLELASMDGYTEAFREFVTHRIEVIGTKGRMTAHAVKLIHGEQLKGRANGCDASDLIDAFHKSIISNWTGVFPKKSHHKRNDATPGCPLGDYKAAWERIIGGTNLPRLGHTTPCDANCWWLYSEDARVHDALTDALVKAADCDGLPAAWRYLRLCNEIEQNIIRGAFRKVWAACWAAHADKPVEHCRERATRLAQASAAEVAA